MSGIVSKATNLATGRQDLAKFDARASEDAQKRAAELQSKYGLYDVDSSLGGVRTVQQDDGTFKRVYSDSAADAQRNALIGQGLSGISLDPTQAQDAYYQQATRQLLPQFEEQQDRLDNNLINRGIGVGTEQYDNQLENLRNTQQGTLADINNQAVFQGQSLLNNQISNIGALTGQRDIGALPSLGGSTGASFQETYSPFFASQNAARQSQNAANAKFMEQLGSAAAGGAGGAGGAGAGSSAGLSAILSDRRLKENLVKIGNAGNGLNIYLGNYNDKALEIDSNLNNNTQVFLIAQEVRDVNPDAVKLLDNGYLAVNYMEALK